MATTHPSPHIVLSGSWDPDCGCSEDEEFLALWNWTPPKYFPMSDREGCSPFQRAHTDTTQRDRPSSASMFHRTADVRSRSSEGHAHARFNRRQGTRLPAQAGHRQVPRSGGLTRQPGQFSSPSSRASSSKVAEWAPPITMQHLSPEACLWEEEEAPRLISRSTAPRMGPAVSTMAGHKSVALSTRPVPRATRSGEIQVERRSATWQREQSAGVGRSPLRRCRDRREVARELHRRRTLACSRWPESPCLQEDEV